MSQSPDHRMVMTSTEECARKAAQTAQDQNARLTIVIMLNLLSLPAAAQQGPNRNDFQIIYRKTMLAFGGQQSHNLEFEYPASDKPAMDGFVTRASYALEAYRTVSCG